MPDLPFPLGQRPEKDEKSRLYPVAESAFGIVDRTWHHNGPISDQGQTSGCVGFTGLDWEETAPNRRKGLVLGNWRGIQNYNGSTEFDQWSDNDRPIDATATALPDEGSSILGLCKYFVSKHRIVGYRWCFGIDQFLNGLMQGPIAAGIEWTNDMFYPDSKGQVKPTGSVAGGHAILFYRYQKMRNGQERVWAMNHWTKNWGVNGRFWLDVADMKNRLDADGEAALMIGAQA